jgi:nucleotide-binding universal stress UspA family protein
MPSIQRILCAVDMSPSDVNVLAYASVMARPFRARVTPFLLRDDEGPSGKDQDQPAELDTRRRAELLCAELLGSVPGRRGPALVRTEPRDILERSGECDSDLIVLGLRVPSDAPQRRATLVDELVRRASCPVLTVPPGVRPTSVSRILLPVDFSAGTERAVEWASTLARRLSASVHVLHAVGSTALRGTPVHRGVSAPTSFDHALAKLAEIERRLRAAGLKCESSIAEQGTTHAILACQARERSDLVVMGVHHRHHDQAAATGMAASIRRRAAVPVFSMTTPDTEAVGVLGRPSEDIRSMPSQALSASASRHTERAPWTPAST